jgi:protein-glutamine gamma-glutamyltransferase
METKRPQLSADDLARLQWLLGSLLALLSAWSTFFMEVDAWLLLGAITFVVVLGLLRPAWPARVPRWAHRLAFPVIFGAFALDLYLTREPLASLIRLDLLLIIYRLMGHRRRREDLQLVVLTLFLVVVAGVLTVSLAFAAQILAFAACALVFLFVMTLTEAEAGPAPNPGPTEPPAWTRGRWSDFFGRLRAAMDWRLTAFSVALFAGVVVVSGLLFLAIPRFEIESGLFLDRLISRKTLSGFSENIRFGEVTAITQDNRLALSVDVDDPRAMPAVPYWRMLVLDEYTGEGFSMSPRLRTFLNRAGMRRIDEHFRRNPPLATWRIYLEPSVSRYLPLLGRYRQLKLDEPQAFAVEQQLGIVALQRDPPKMLPYEVRGMEIASMLPDPEFARERSSGEPSGFLAHSLAPSDRDRLERIVRQLQPAGANDGAPGFAARAVDWLERHHTYSMESVLPPGPGDPLVRWVDSDTPGHCEFFAGALVLLARTAGYPARVVTGFKGGTWNAYSNSFAVRNANAHAWCEVFDDATGAWLRVDPTPGSEAAARIAEESGEAGRQGRAFETGWNARLESLRVFWYRRIVNFDESSQRELAVTAKQAMQSAATRFRSWLDARAADVQRWVTRPWGWTRVLRWVVLAAVALALAWSWHRYGRSWWLRWRSGHSRPGGDPVRREAGRWLRRLEQRAAPAPPAEKDVREALLRLRYGASSTWPDPAAVFRAAKRVHRTSR